MVNFGEISFQVNSVEQLAVKEQITVAQANELLGQLKLHGNERSVVKNNLSFEINDQKIQKIIEGNRYFIETTTKISLGNKWAIVQPQRFESESSTTSSTNAFPLPIPDSPRSYDDVLDFLPSGKGQLFNVTQEGSVLQPGQYESWSNNGIWQQTFEESTDGADPSLSRVLVQSTGQSHDIEESKLSDEEVMSIAERESLSVDIVKKFLEQINVHRGNFIIISKFFMINNIKLSSDKVVEIYQNNRALIEKFVGDTIVDMGKKPSLAPLTAEEKNKLTSFFNKRARYIEDSSFDRDFITAYLEGLESYGKSWGEISTYIYCKTGFEINNLKLRTLCKKITTNNYYTPQVGTFKFKQDATSKVTTSETTGSGTIPSKRQRVTKENPFAFEIEDDSQYITSSYSTPSISHSISPMPLQELPRVPQFPFPIASSLTIPTTITHAVEKSSVNSENEPEIISEIKQKGTNWLAIEASLKAKNINISSKRLLSFFEANRSNHFSHISYTPIKRGHLISPHIMGELMRAFNMMNVTGGPQAIINNLIMNSMALFGTSWHEISDHLYNYYRMNISSYELKLFYKSLKIKAGLS